MTPLQLADHILPRIIDIRRHIHANPELSFKEHQTAGFIASCLNEEHITFRKTANTGILASIEGHNPKSRTVMLRADIDALPICETTDVEFKSQNEGVMHACGHDIHTATLLGALMILNGLRDKFEGTILGLFQPGEELNPGGASLVLAENPLDGMNNITCISSHIDPELPTGSFGLRVGKYMASSDELRFTVHGTGGHGALRANIKDPVMAAADLILRLHTIPDSAPDKTVPTVLSIGRVTANGATNIIPDDVFLEGTLRVFDEAWREQAHNIIDTICRQVGAKYGVTVTPDISKGYPSVINDASVVDKALTIIEKDFGKGAITMLPVRPTADDFGSFTQRYPSMLIRIGTAAKALDPSECATASAGKLHTPTLCPNERALRYSVAAFVDFALNI